MQSSFEDLDISNYIGDFSRTKQKSIIKFSPANIHEEKIN